MNVFELNKIYDFNTLVPSILGSSYKSMKVKGILTAEGAMKYRDIHTLHNNLISSIPGLPQDIEDCVFLLLENTDKTRIILAVEYIDHASVTNVTTTNIRIEVRNTNITDLEIIRTRLLELGYSDITLSRF